MDTLKKNIGDMDHELDKLRDDARKRGDDPKLQGLNKQQLDEELSKGKANHEEVLEAGQQAALDMQGLILRIVSQL